VGDNNSSELKVRILAQSHEGKPHSLQLKEHRKELNCVETYDSNSAEQDFVHRFFAVNVYKLEIG